MNYSRTNPSERYRYLQSLYRQMHEQGYSGVAADAMFAGYSLDAQMERIKRLIEVTEARTLLDYGCGKGRQYEPRLIRDKAGVTWPSVVDFWDLDELACYDPNYERFSVLPAGRFDGVISTDVLEHCPEEDIDWILGEIFGYAARFVFANVACYTARKTLPNGENAHCTVRPAEWWIERISNAAAARDDVLWEFWFQTRVNMEEPPLVNEFRASGRGAQRDL